MLTPENLLRISEGAEEIAEYLHQDILSRIIERILIRIGRGDDYILTSADKWQIELLQDAGYLLKDIQADIANRLPDLQTEIAEAMEDAGVKALSYDNSIYEAAGLSALPLDQSPALIRIAQRNYEATMGELTNFTRTMAEAAQQAYIQACDKAYTQVISGSLSYTQAVREAVNDMVRDGVTVAYPSGHTDTIETATLRAVRTGVSQASGQITDARMEEMEWDTIIVSSHLGARDTGKSDYTNHAWWQGKFYSKSGKDSRFPPFSVCGQGNVQGIHGANCRHSHGPGDGEHNPFEQFDSEENRKACELQQRQRTLERRIRDTKREVMGLNTARQNAEGELREILEADYQRKSALLQKQNKAYNDFCEENDLKKLSDRISIAKWDRSQAAQARAAAKRYHSEWLKSIGAEGTSLKTLDKYLSAQYNNTDEYGLLKGYKNAVEKGDISPLVKLEQYKVTAASIDEHIIGQFTSTGIQVEGYTTHFVDRVIGQVSEPHKGKRCGVLVTDVLDAIANPIDVSGVKVMQDGDRRQTYTGAKAKVTISITDRIIIQTNPWSEK